MRLMAVRGGLERQDAAPIDDSTDASAAPGQQVGNPAHAQRIHKPKGWSETGAMLQKATPCHATWHIGQPQPAPAKPLQQPSPTNEPGGGPGT